MQLSQPDDMSLPNSPEIGPDVSSFPAALAACPANFSPQSAMLEDEGGEMSREDDVLLPLVFAEQKEDFAFVDSSLLKNWAGQTKLFFFFTLRPLLGLLIFMAVFANAGAAHWKFKAPAKTSGMFVCVYVCVCVAGILSCCCFCYFNRMLWVRIFKRVSAHDD